ncbi:hypothetical protein WEI85_18725 [Actinomycetes bacterium KLBMP 9797]
MTDEAHLLTDVRTLRLRARADRQGYGVPLLLSGLLTLGATPLYIQPADATGPADQLTSQSPPDNPAVTGLGGDFLDRSAALGAYWLVALLFGYLATLAWYRWHAHRVGVATPVRPYLIAGVIGIAIGVAAPFVLEFLLINSNAPFGAVAPLATLSGRGLLPHLIIAAGLVVLARLERSRTLALLAAGFAVVVLLASAAVDTVSSYTFAIVAALPAAILLAGGAITLLRPRKSA